MKLIYLAVMRNLQYQFLLNLKDTQKKKKLFLNNERENTLWEKCGYDNEQCI